jgi:hypothetical protein
MGYDPMWGGCRFARAARLGILIAVGLLVLLTTSWRAEAALVQRNVRTSHIYRTSVYLTAGYDYEIQTSDLDNGGDTVMHLLDSTNQSVTGGYSDDYAPPARWSQINFTAATTGTYFVVVRSYSTGTEGYGKVQWHNKWHYSSTWSAWSYLSGSELFGGNVVAVDPNHAEYWTVMVQAILCGAYPPPCGGTNDTVLYAMGSGGGIVGYDDDGGVGWMSRYPRPSGTGVYNLLVGSYAYGSTGVTDIIANDPAVDADADTVATNLEVELGTCESPLGGCTGVSNMWDSDHDGLTDPEEIFGKDYPADKSKALHFPARGSDPRVKDVFIEQDYADAPACCESVYCPPAPPPTPLGCWPSSVIVNEAMLADVQTKYAVATAAEVRNLGGINGIALHFDIAGSGDPCPAHRKVCGGWGGGGDRTIDYDSMHASRSQRFRHMINWPNVGSSTVVASWYIGAWAERYTISHELGHSLGLAHDGNWQWNVGPGQPGLGTGWTGDFQNMNCKSNYRSLMNYSFGFRGADDATRWANYNFSRGTTSVLDPGNISDVATASGGYGASDASFLEYDGWPLNTGHVFPYADTFGNVDWNRDGSIDGVNVRGSYINNGPVQCGAQHQMVYDTLLTAGGNYAAVTPDISALGGFLYPFYLSSGQTLIFYPPAPHSGNSDRGGCSVGTGRALSFCNTPTGLFNVPIASPAATITGLAAYAWNGQMVVAWRNTSKEIWVNQTSGTNPNPSTGELTGWGTPIRVATNVESSDIEMSAMYVSTANYPGTAAPWCDGQGCVLAIFYTSGTGALAAHRMTYTVNPSSVLGTWETHDVLVLGTATAVAGTQAPGVAVWPAPSASGVLGANTGYACGIFPGIPSADGTTRSVDLYCYDRVSDQWRDLTSVFHITDAVGPGRPAFAFHTLRAASGSPIEWTSGQFWAATMGQGLGARTYPRLWVSTKVSSTNQPSAALQFFQLQSTWANQDGRGMAFYADRDISAVKGLSMPMRGDPAAATLELDGIIDGSWHAELKGGNDFHVMEHGICRGVRDAPVGGSWCGSPYIWPGGEGGYSL